MPATTDKYDALIETITTAGIAVAPVIPDQEEKPEIQDDGVEENPEELEGIEDGLWLDEASNPFGDRVENAPTVLKDVAKAMRRGKVPGVKTLKLSKHVALGFWQADIPEKEMRKLFDKAVTAAGWKRTSERKGRWSVPAWTKKGVYMHLEHAGSGWGAYAGFNFSIVPVDYNPGQDPRAGVR